MTVKFPNDHVLLPNFDNGKLGQFAIPFCRLMVAYSNLDREIASLVRSATGDPSDENEFKRGSVTKLGRQIEKFISRKGGDISRIGEIKEQINCATEAYALRNDLAHGHWWKFDPTNNSVSVRRDRKMENRFIEIRVTDIEQAINKFEEVEVELYKIRRELQKQAVRRSVLGEEDG
jgi:hypothetical protein